MKVSVINIQTGEEQLIDITCSLTNNGLEGHIIVYTNEFNPKKSYSIGKIYYNNTEELFNEWHIISRPKSYEGTHLMFPDVGKLKQRFSKLRIRYEELLQEVLSKSREYALSKLGI